jgi:UDP-N-acetylglucosamine acyltransferase
MLFEGHQARVRQVNVVGLERAGFAPERIAALQEAFRVIYRSANPQRRSVELLRERANATPELTELCDALDEQARGLKGRFRETLRAQFAKLGAERILGELHVGELHV